MKGKCSGEKMKGLVVFVGLLYHVGAIAPSVEEVKDAIVRARETHAFQRDLNLGIRSETIKTMDQRSPLARYHGMRKTAKVTSDMKANDLLMATKILLDAGYTKEQLRNRQVVKELRRQVGNNCPPKIVSCDAGAKYRTANGSCNNLENPTWGMANIAQARVVEAAYDDDLTSPRVRSVIPGKALPNPRDISNEVHVAAPAISRSNRINLHVFQMGQFLDHDIIATPVQGEVYDESNERQLCSEIVLDHDETATLVQGEVTDCCTTPVDSDNCMPIRIDSDNDPFFFNGYCMNFPRSAPRFCPTVSDNSRREQTNAITSFIDASNVYGSSLKDQKELRVDGDGAFLRTEKGDRLPNNVNNQACDSDINRGIYCSLAGDHRVNVIPSLTAYHTLFVREHNRIAAQLRDSFPNDEELFQETRKLVIAIMQKIVYDEFLPSFLSSDAIQKYGLASSTPYTYSPTVNPTATNNFGIAFRMGHTWIPRTMDIFNENFRRVKGRRTEDTYDDPALTYFQGPPPGLDGLAMWLTGENSPETDRIIENAARNALFLDDAGNSFDLAALNIQRGRDHGLPSYTVYRKYCLPDSPDVINFDDLTDHDYDSRRRLRKAYSDPRDIDLFTGLLTETPVTTDAMGPTLECLLGEQFSKLKFGDRFWYQGSATAYNDAQLRAISAYTTAKILCNNYGFATVNAPNAFLATDELVACENIPQLDIKPFRLRTHMAAPTRPQKKAPKKAPTGVLTQADPGSRPTRIERPNNSRINKPSRPRPREQMEDKDSELEGLLEDLVEKLGRRQQ